MRSWTCSIAGFGLNVAAFHYDYKNLQVNITRALDVITLNAAAAKIDGAEAEITVLPLDNLRLAINASYLDARYASFVNTDPVYPELGPQNLKGNRLNYSPEWKIGSEAGYTIQSAVGKIIPRVNVTWVEREFFSPFNQLSASQKARTLVDAYLGFESANGLWSANAFVKNLTDRTYVVSGVASSALVGYPIVGQYGAPRTYGVSVTRRL